MIHLCKTILGIQPYDVHNFNVELIKKCKKWEIIFEDQSFTLKMVLCAPASEDGPRYLLSPTGEIEPSLYLFHLELNVYGEERPPNFEAKIVLSEADMKELKAVQKAAKEVIKRAVVDAFLSRNSESESSSSSAAEHIYEEETNSEEVST
ncbi:hypothetical protein V9T40_012723 [Parthenolecanium corni]|uniref:Uncharacterized protein n=1 Tax=Parthenolecanium corni TaxID=536013 RepID=A0AAN9XZL0_9HEMI